VQGNLTVAVAGSQIFFSYVSYTTGAPTVKVAGVYGTASSFMVDSNTDTIDMSSVAGVPIMYNTNNASVTILVPQNNYMKTTRMIAYDVYGGLRAVGISPGSCRRDQDNIQKVGVFEHSCTSFVPGVRYYAQPSGLLTTSAKSGTGTAYAQVGVALETDALNLNLYN